MAFAGERIADWLRQKEWDTGQLVRWLQGYDFDWGGQQDPSYMRLLRGLPGVEYAELKQELAIRTGKLLGERIDDLHPAPRRPHEALYNLLMLCYSLANPKQLAEPLLAMHDDARGKHTLIHEQWEGHEIGGALRSALITNQIDPRLNRVWLDMIHNDGDELLKGDAYEGLNGLFWMFPGPNRLGDPCVEAILEGIEELVMWMKREIEAGKMSPQRAKARLQEVFDQVARIHRGISWEWLLLELVDHKHWYKQRMDWTFNALPSQAIFHGQYFYIRRAYVDKVLDDYSKQILHIDRCKSIYDGAMLAISQKNLEATHVIQRNEEKWHKLEVWRRNFDFPSDAAINDMINVNVGGITRNAMQFERPMPNRKNLDRLAIPV